MLEKGNTEALFYPMKWKSKGNQGMFWQLRSQSQFDPLGWT